MASLQTSLMLFSSPSLKRNNATINVLMKSRRMPLLVPNISTKKMIHEANGYSTTGTNPLEENVVTTKTYGEDDLRKPWATNTTIQLLFAILESVADRVAIHNHIGEQRDNWNTLLLNSINIITLTATAMAGLAAASGGAAKGATRLALKLSSTLLFSAATGMLLVMNKIQPSQLAEEQRNATRLFKQLQSHIETTMALGNPTEEDVKDAMEKVLALDKAFPLPLLGAMLDKFPAKFEPAVWWPWKSKPQEGKPKSYNNKKMERSKNGWSEELEMELREVVEVVKRKDSEEYKRLGSLVLKVSKVLAILGPLLTGIAAIGSAFIGNGSSWAITLVPLLAGSLAAAINTFEHGGQVGMVFEVYRTSAGFFKMLETSIESTLEEKDLEKRENGEVFEMKVAMELGRSVSQLRELALKSASYRMGGIHIDEFASKVY